VVQRLEDLPALAAGKYFQLLAVLGDRASRDFDVLAAKKFTIFWSECGRLTSSASNDLLDLQFDRLRRQSSPSLREMPELKKYFSSKMPCGVWTYLLVVTRETVDSWHANVLGHVAQNERLQVGRPLLEELTLEAQDGLGDTHDGALALLDGPNQPLGTAQAFLDVLSRLGAFAKRLPVEVRNLSLGRPSSLATTKYFSPTFWM